MVTVFESLKSAIASILKSISTESSFWSTVAVSYFRLLPNAIASPRATHYWHLLTFIDIYWHLLTYFKYFHYSQSRGPSFLQHRMQHPHRLTSRQGFFPGRKSEALTLLKKPREFKALASVAPEVAKQLPSQTRFVLLFHLAHQSLSGWSSEETTLTWKLKTSKTHKNSLWSDMIDMISNYQCRFKKMTIFAHSLTVRKHFLEVRLYTSTDSIVAALQPGSWHNLT